MIESIELKYFRNHLDTKINFSPNITFLEGLNGAGKTNVLEAIYFVSFLKSFRTNDDKVLIMDDKPFSKIKLKTNKNTYKVIIQESSKHLKINNAVISKMSEFIGGYKVILFSPEDLKLVTGIPQVRRSFLDIEMVQLNLNFLENLSVYKKVLKQRNALLKQLKKDDDLTFLKIINKRMEEEANVIIKQRQTFIDKLNEAFISRFKVFNTKDRVELIYEPNSPLNKLEMILNTKLETDLIAQSTSFGPHRDELVIKFNNKLAKENASQGQIRLIAISLKLALLDLMKEEEVVLLLDDILSELDETVTKKMRKLINLDRQIIMTGTKNDIDLAQLINLDKRGVSSGT